METTQLKIEEDGTLVIPTDLLHQIDLSAGDEVTIHQADRQLVISSRSLPGWEDIERQPVENLIECAQDSDSESALQVAGDTEISGEERDALWESAILRGR